MDWSMTENYCWASELLLGKQRASDTADLEPAAVQGRPRFIPGARVGRVALLMAGGCGGVCVGAPRKEERKRFGLAPSRRMQQRRNP